jgi:protein-disulfide isomerase
VRLGAFAEAPLRASAAGFLVAVALISAGCGGGGRMQRAEREFAGIPQHGAALGSPAAAYTMVEFVDLQCPYCARFDRDVLPAVIQRFVGPGRLRLELKPIPAIGPESAPAGAATIAAGMQDRMWQFADLFYRNQGPENSGYVTQAFVARVAGAVPGLDASRLSRELASGPVRAILTENAREAQTARITGTPGFRLGRTGGVLAPFEGRGLARSDFLRRLAATIAGS